METHDGDRSWCKSHRNTDIVNSVVDKLVILSPTYIRPITGTLVRI